MKRLLKYLFAFILVMSLTACGVSTETNGETKFESVDESSEETVDETVDESVETTIETEEETVTEGENSGQVYTLGAGEGMTAIVGQDIPAGSYFAEPYNPEDAGGYTQILISPEADLCMGKYG